jgi:hypothetical protein
MANDSEKLNRLVAKLISDTRSRQVRWRAIQKMVSALSNVNTPMAALGIRGAIEAQPTMSYIASLDESRGFRLDSVDHLRGGGGLLALLRPHTLHICDRDGRSVKELGVTTGLNDLYAAILDQIVGADEFIDTYLGQ